MNESAFLPSRKLEGAFRAGDEMLRGITEAISVDIWSLSRRILEDIDYPKRAISEVLKAEKNTPSEWEEVEPGVFRFNGRRESLTELLRNNTIEFGHGNKQSHLTTNR